MALTNKNPDALAGAVRANRIVYADKTNRIQTSHRPQLHRHGDTSSMLAFIDAPDGSPIGHLARGNTGWNAVRFGSAHALNFSTALRAVRFLIGARP